MQGPEENEATNRNLAAVKPTLDILAGPSALRALRARGLQADDVDMVAGASGGPKWISLYGIDRVLLGLFATRSRPLHLIGSSSGAWRMACWAQADPLAALDRLAEAYIGQRYPKKPPPALVSDTCARLLSHVLGERGIDDILSHPWARLHVLTACCHGLLASDRKALLLAGLGVAGLTNFVSRQTLGWWMTRVVFHAGTLRESPFAALHDLPTRHVPFSSDNLHAALLASGSIPLILSSVGIPDAPWGRHRDGAMTDYHLDLDYNQGAGLVLYPHFFPRIIPGWLDKMSPWRRGTPRNFDRVVMLAPSAHFVSRLPRRKIPDRDDFYQCTDAQRMRVWEAVKDATTEMGEELAELIASGRIAERARPLIP